MTVSLWVNRAIVGIVSGGIGIGIGYLIRDRSQSPLVSTKSSFTSTAAIDSGRVTVGAESAEPKDASIEATAPVQVLADAERAGIAMDWLFSGVTEPSSADFGAMRSVMAKWAVRDLSAAQAWLNDHSDHPGAESFFEGMVETLTASDPSTAMEWALRHPSDHGKVQNWASASLPILFSDPDQVELLLDQSTFDDQEKESVREHWNHAMASAQRNAQNIVGVMGAAQAAGTEFVPNSVESLVEQLTKGVIGAGSFSDSVFKVSPLSPVQLEMVKVFVEVDEAGNTRYRSPVN